MSRHFREAYRSIVKNSWMSFASIGTVAVTLLIFGVFIITAFNLSYFTSEVKDNLKIRVSLRNGMTKEQVDSLMDKIKNMEKVNAEQVYFVPKDQGAKEFKEAFGNEPFVENLKVGEGNPFPDLITVLPKNINDMQEVASEIETNMKKDGVTSANPGVVQSAFLDFSSIANKLILAFGLVLAILSAFLISNTIKLTIIARRREIEVMRLVGASNWFIRWPFFIEGGFIGFVGAIFPTGILLILYQTIYSFFNEGSLIQLLPMLPVMNMSLYLIGCMFALGTVIGIVGSVLSVHRFLRV